MSETNYRDVVNVLRAIKEGYYGVSIIGIQKHLALEGICLPIEDIKLIVSLAEDANLLEVHKICEYTFYSPKEE